VKPTPKARYRDISAKLRDSIVQGVYAPGHRLPTRTEMVEQYGASVATVQRALNSLVDDGFVYARARAGTFVVDKPPHLCNYGLVIPSPGLWSRFYKAAQAATQAIETGDTVRFREYHTSREVGSRGDMARLCRDVVNHRLAGLILTGSPLDLTDLQEMLDTEQPGIPRVAIENYPGLTLPMVFADETSFLDRAVEYLFSRNRRRIAHLYMDFSWVHLGKFEAALSQRGAEVRPYWIQPIPVGPTFRGAAHVVNMMMQLEGDKRPNGLIIHDDNLVEHAMAGLLAAGVKVPDELEVVANCNFPAPVPSVLPVRHLGSDLRLVIKECLRVIEMQRRGETPPAKTRLPALFEDEID